MAIIRDRTTELDPAFAVPPNVVDVRQLNREDGSQYYEAPEEFVEELVEVVVPEQPDQALAMPSGFRVFEQRVKISSDGRAVVDVILDFYDADESLDIELQVTKI